MEIVKLFARLLLLIAGLGHLIPGLMNSILHLGVGQITLQFVIGLLSVVVALFLLLKKVP